MKEARFWEQDEGGRVRCHLCQHDCLIAENKVGICGVRKNFEGQLFSLNYGKLISANIDPIEKKPLYHFLPGSRSYSIAATGCNLRCQWCQNWSISQTNERNHPDRFEFVEPDHVVKAALKAGCESISYTYTEPTVFYEYALDVSKLAHQAGLKNVWVSNGFMGQGMLDEYLPYLDAINIDIKAFDEKTHRKYTGASLQQILENCKRVKQAGVWLEVTTLVVPGINDSHEQVQGLAEFILQELGAGTPWHVSRFYPQEQFRDLPATDPRSIEQVLKLARSLGLQFVYAGNLGKGEDSYCPGCGKLLVARSSVWLLDNWIAQGRCPDCSQEIAGVWE